MRTVRLADLCEIHVGRTPARANVDFWGTGAPWLSIADMNQGLSITRTKEQITSEGEWRGGRVDVGTVLLSFKLSIGKVAIADTPLFTNEAIAALPVRDASRLDSRYLLRALQAMDLSRSSNRAAMGATLNKAALMEIPVPLPPIEEQRRIAAILDCADALRVRRRQVLAHLDSLKQSLYETWFGLAASMTRRPAASPLSDWVDPSRPITYGILKPGPDTPDGIPYVRVADMQGGHVRLDSVRRTTAAIHSQYRRSTLRSGDLLMSIRGHVGRFVTIPSELEGANITQDSARLAVVDADRAVYVRATLESRTLQAWMGARTKGAAVRGINLGDLRNAPIPVADDKKITKFAAALRQIEAQQSPSALQSTHMDETFASLQARAFRGEL